MRISVIDTASGRCQWACARIAWIRAFAVGGVHAACAAGLKKMSVLSATDCRFSSGSPKIPQGIPILNMVGENDCRWGGSGCSIFRTVAESRLVVIEGAGHKLGPLPEAHEVLERFLEACRAKSD